MAGYTTGTAFLRIAPSMAGFHTRLRSELRGIKPEPVLSVRVKPDIKQSEFRVPRVPDQTVTIKAKVDKSLIDTANAVSLLSRNIAGFAKPVAIAAAIPEIVALGQAALQASTSLLLLPAAALAAGAAFGAVKIGLSNVSDALGPTGTPAQLKKVEEALAKLSPAARNFVGEIRQFTPTFNSLKLSTQEALFKGLGRSVDELGKKYLPVAKVGFTGIATEVNLAARETGNYLAQSQQVSTVATIFAGTRATMAELRPVGRDIVAIILDIAAVGTEFLPGLAGGFAEGTTKAREFFAEARQSGQLRTWISEGMSAVGDFGATFISLGSIVASVFRGSGMESRSFTESLREGAAQVAEFMKSARGQEQIHQFFTVLRQIGEALWPLVVAVGKAFYEMFLQISPHLPGLITGLKDVFAATGPMLGIFTQLAIAILPAFSAALSYLAPILGPLIVLIVSGYTAFKIYERVLVGIKAAQIAYGIVLGLTKIAQLGFAGAQAAATSATVGMTVAQRAMNLTMMANPIGLIIIAIIALAAILIYAWNNCETFRNIVTGAWEAIKTAASVAWEWLKEIFASFMTAVEDVGRFFSDLWGTVQMVWGQIVAAFEAAWAFMQPIFEAIGNVIKNVVMFYFEAWWFLVRVVIGAIGAIIFMVWDTLIRPTFDVVVGFIRDQLIPWFLGLWEDAVKPAWEGIGAIITWIWESVIKPAWDAIVGFINDVIIPAVLWLWHDVITPAWEGIGSIINWVWENVIKPTWDAVVGFINNIIIPAVMWLWNNVIKPAWDGMGMIIQDVYNNVIKPIFDKFVEAGEWVGRKFDEAVAFIKDVWAKVKTAVRDPIQAVIDVVYNHGIVDSWNKIADFIGLGDQKLTYFVLPQFAEGGKVTGPGTGTSDSVLARVSAGEYIVPADTTRSHFRFLEALRAGQAEAVQAAGGRQANPQFNRAAGGTRRYATGGIVEHAAGIAREMSGKPYRWGGASRDGADCSGYQSIITNALRGDPNPYHRIGTTANFPWGGFARGLGGAYAVGSVPPARGYGHMAGTLAGVNVESGGSPSKVKYGAGAVGADHRQFSTQAFLPQVGGVFASGGEGGGGVSFDPLGWVMEQFGDIVGTIAGVGAGKGGIWNYVRGFGTKIWEVMKTFAVDKATKWGGGASFGAVLETGPVQEQMKAVAAQFGWDKPPQWPAIQFIVSHESSFNPNADNPTSTAYGLFQLLDGTWGSTGIAKSSSVVDQTRAGLTYIRNRYGNPVGAMEFWRAKHWYDQGGVASGSGFLMKQALTPERVLSGRQTRAFEALVSAQTGRQFGTRIVGDTPGATGAAGSAPFIGTLVVPVPEGSSVDETIDAVMTRARAESRRGRYARP